MLIFMKKCVKCQQTKQVTEFYKASHTNDGLQGWCKECSKQRVKQYNESNRIQQRFNNKKGKIKHSYNITVEELAHLEEQQGYLCAICNQLPVRKPLQIDHCHANGHVRGLLCSGCNIGIGHLRDDTERLRRAIEYLT